MAKSDFHFIHRLRVRWSEVDRQDVAFFGNYLNYFDTAMTEYMRALGFAYPQGLLDRGTDFYVVKSEVNYKGSATFDDVVEIHTRIGRLGASSARFEFEIYREGEEELLISGLVVYVNVDLEKRESAPMPDELIERVAALEGESVCAS